MFVITTFIFFASVFIAGIYNLKIAAVIGLSEFLLFYLLAKWEEPPKGFFER